MARASGVTAVVDAAAVPYLAGARQALADGFVSGGTRRNLDWVRPHTDLSAVVRGRGAAARRRADLRRPAARRRDPRRAGDRRVRPARRSSSSSSAEPHSRRAPPRFSYVRCMLAAFVSTPAPKDPLSVLEVGDRPEPEAPDGWTTVQVKAVSLNHHDLFSLQGIGLPAGADADDPGHRRGGARRGRQRGRRPRRRRHPRLDRRRDAGPQAHAVLRAAPGHDGREGRRPAAEPAAQAGRAVLRRGRLPAHGVADRLPDAVREVRACGPGRRCSCRAPAAGSRRR